MPKDKTERGFVRRLAHAIAKANGHSHPEEWAEEVAKHHVVDDDEPSETDAESSEGTDAPTKEAAPSAPEGD